MLSILFVHSKGKERWIDRGRERGRGERREENHLINKCILRRGSVGLFIY